MCILCFEHLDLRWISINSHYVVYLQFFKINSSAFIAIFHDLYLENSILYLIQADL